jgi:hypothetical protein
LNAARGVGVPPNDQPLSCCMRALAA